MGWTDAFATIGSFAWLPVVTFLVGKYIADKRRRQSDVRQGVEVVDPYRQQMTEQQEDHERRLTALRNELDDANAQIDWLTTYLDNALGMLRAGGITAPPVPVRPRRRPRTA